MEREILMYEGKEYKEIPGYDGNYCISKDGDILSLRGFGVKRMKTSTLKTGYRTIGLYKEVGKPILKSVAFCILEAWDKPRPSIKHKAFYKDRNKENLHLDNLEWKTRSEIIKITRKEYEKRPDAKYKKKRQIIAIFDGLEMAHSYLKTKLDDHIDTNLPNAKGVYIFTPEGYEKWKIENASEI